jgi:glutathione reductase (NADPH)
MAQADVDLFVIGGGSGGLRAAWVAASQGARVVLAEKSRLGGTCVIRGCIPKKLFVYASRFRAALEDSDCFGWTMSDVHFEWERLVSMKNREIGRLENVYTDAQLAAGVEIVKSRAVIESAGSVRLLSDERRFRARHILIATGAKPLLVDIPGIEFAITSDQIFDLPRFPKRLVVAGAGYIAIELAGLFAGLGSDVAIVCRRDNVLRGFDDDLREAVCESYERRGIRLVFNDTLARIEREPESGVLTATTHAGVSIQTDEVLMAVGRAPNAEGLGLESIGVARRSNGAIVVNGQSETNVPGLYAVGDVTDRANLTPVALREGQALSERLFGNARWTVDYDLIPKAVFCTPEVATVGMTEEEARSRLERVAVYRTSFRALKEVAAGRVESTQMKVIVDRSTDRVVGAHFFADGASEIIQVIAVAMRAGVTMSQLQSTMAVHPTLGEELVTLREPTKIYERQPA